MILVVCLAALLLALRRYADLEQFVAQEQAVRGWLHDNPIVGVMLGLLAYTGLSLIPGTTGKSLVAGWLFGFWIGALVMNCGLTAAAMASFLVSRHLLHDAIQSRFGLYLLHLNEVLVRAGGSYVLALRVLHAPFTLVNYALGATPIRACTFWWATQLGLLPANLVLAYAGSRLPTLRSIAEQGLWSVFSIDLVAALAVLSILPFVVQRAGRYLQRRLGRPVDKPVAQ